MPKIIENLPERLVLEARRQILMSGYSATTIRSVAKACNISVGTVYNYYSSKEELAAAFLLDDWMRNLRSISANAARCDQFQGALAAVYDGLNSYVSLYAPVFQDRSAAANYPQSILRFHSTLRSQLSEPIRRFCPDDFTAEFISESLITWTVSGRSFQEIYDILKKII